MIQTLEDILLICALDFKNAWNKHLTLIKFSYNNIYHYNIEMAPYEALCGKRHRTRLFWQEVDEALAIGPILFKLLPKKIKVI